jgi:hypothetical protein
MHHLKQYIDLAVTGTEASCQHQECIQGLQSIHLSFSIPRAWRNPAVNLGYTSKLAHAPAHPQQMK